MLSINDFSTPFIPQSWGILRFGGHPQATGIRLWRTLCTPPERYCRERWLRSNLGVWKSYAEIASSASGGLAMT